MLCEREIIALGALFHDIGKVVQRAAPNPRTMTHQEFGAQWIKEHFSGSPYEELRDFALYHHFNPTNRPELDVVSQNRNDLLLVAHADNLSSGEREYEDAAQRFNPRCPLMSVFSSVIIKGKPEPPSLFYRPKSLHDGIVYPEKNVSLTAEDYLQVLNRFQQALGGRILAPDPLLNILEEHFSLIPSHTVEVGNNSTDVSLFDHIKTTAAIAIAAYNYLTETYPDIRFSQIPLDEITNINDKRYLLIGVDVSGIQDFIYTISSKGALKLLRARSFYIEMLLEFVATRMLEELNLFRTNLLFLGGGNFTILAQATENAEKLVDSIIAEFNERLFKEHGGKLWLAHAYIPFEGKVFERPKEKEPRKTTIADILQGLHDKLQDAKMHKFHSIDKDELFKPYDVEGYYECEVCGLEISKKDWERDRRCKICRSLFDLGDDIHKAKYIVYGAKDSREKLGEIKICAEERLYFFKKPISGKYMWAINPSRDEPIEYGATIYMGNYPNMSRNFTSDIQAEKAPSFNYFGTKLVGTLRMDVDNLGVIFAKGLPYEKRTISRISTFSRFMNLFFKRYINDIAAGKLGEGVKQFSVVHPDGTHPREVVIVYAGGDDLFIVGAWHDVIEMAFDIHESFRKFVGGEHITISGGLALNHTKHPIHLFARDAGNAEDKAKKFDGKNAFTVFNKTLKWEKWRKFIGMDSRDGRFLLDVRNTFYEKVQFIGDEKISKFSPNHLPRKKQMALPSSFIYHLMQISEELSDGFRIKPYAILAYLLGRNKSIGKHFGYLLDILNYREMLKHLKPLLMWLDLLQRNI